VHGQWFRNGLSRLVKAPKLHLIDSGLLTAMRGYSLSRLRADRTLFGALLESFIFSELLKLSAWAEEQVMLFHYRGSPPYSDLRPIRDIRANEMPAEKRPLIA
jgi:predicted AAA+ superfamily ATPase